MKNISFEPALFTGAKRSHSGAKGLRRASLLAGACLFLQAAPAFGQACGPVPPGGGTVTCPPGEYPNGIDYTEVRNLEVLLQPGVVTRSSSEIQSLSNVRVIGPINTSLNASAPDFAPAALRVFAFRSVFVQVDDLSSTATNVGGLNAFGSGSVVVTADTVRTTGNGASGFVISEGATNPIPGLPPANPPPPGFPSTGIFGRVNLVETLGNDSPGVRAISSLTGQVRLETGSVLTRGDRSPGIIAGAESFFPVSQLIGGVSVQSGTVNTTGEQSVGISARGGVVNITSGSVTTTGASSTGIDAEAASGIDIVSGSTATSGFSSTGISAVTPSGPITIASSSVITRGESSGGISAQGTGPITVNSGTIATFLEDSTGLTAASTTGPIRVTSGSITTARSAGMNLSSVSGDIEVTSNSVVTQGASSNAETGAAILARTDGRISVASGSITTAGTQAFGIYAVGDGVSISSNTIATTGRLANAIYAVSFGSNAISVTSGPISTVGDSASGVVTFLFGSGTTTIRTGSITTQGFDSYGVIATTRAGTGSIDVTSDGTIVTTGASSPGISAEVPGSISISANNISVSGANSDAIAVLGANTTVTIRGLVQSSQGFAVRGQGGLRQNPGPGGPVTVNIAGGGTLRGRVSFTPGADRIVNSGIFDAIGTSQFGAGADIFDNNAGATLRSVNGAAIFADLETLDNRGLVEMRDGAVNDSLSLPGSYFGAGAARLGLDVNLAAGTADRLITGAATGSTAIEIQSTGTGRFTSGILLVDAGAGTSPTAFSLVGASSSPYLQSSLRFDAANNDFLLVQLPGAAVFETSRLGGMASQLWYESADAVAAQLDTVRDGLRGRGMALWLQGWTGEHERNGTQSLAGAGTFDVSFAQDFQGLQGGFDFRRGGGVLGITAGAGRSDATFVSGNPVDMNVRNIGLYAQGRTGPLWVNALAKKDWVEMEIAPGAGLEAEFDGDLFGIQGNAGLRLEAGALFAEPSVGLSWVRADLDSFQSGPATVATEIAESLRARAGLRVGARLPIGGGALLPFAAADLYEELDDGNETHFTLGETLRLFDEPIGTRGRAAAGLGFVSPGFEAFVRGEMDFRGDVDAKAVRVGARLRF
jgi:hypothetical protein